ncbi:MAG: ATP-binding protein, partial [Microcystaceae cyanobacterium]
MTYPDLSHAAREPSPIWGESPYPGLRSFQVEDAPYFFGRSAAIAALQGMLEQDKVVVLVGNSGTGKSSLLRAGLMHQLQASEINQEIKLLQPGEQP